MAIFFVFENVSNRHKNEYICTQKQKNKMDWLRFLSILCGAGGLITSFIAIYMARAKKIAIEVGTLQGVIKTMQEDRDKMEDRHQKQDEEHKREISSLKTEMKLFEQRDMIQREAIISAHGCSLPSDIKQCPVLVTYKEKCQNNDGVCKIN